MNTRTWHIPGILCVALFAVACGGKSVEGTNPGECTNGIDDDGNGLMDCDDANCFLSPDCEDSADTGETTGGDEDGDGTGDDGTGDGGSGDDGTGDDGGTGADGSTGDDGSGDAGSGSGDEGSSGDGGEATGDDGGTPDGASLYADFCAGCHGASGEGASGPPLEDQFAHHTDEELIGIILNGDGTMPPTAVTSDEAQAIVDFLRDLFSGG